MVDELATVVLKVAAEPVSSAAAVPAAAAAVAAIVASMGVEEAAVAEKARAAAVLEPLVEMLVVASSRSKVLRALEGRLRLPTVPHLQ